MRFGHPYFFRLFMIVPVILLFYVWAFKKKSALIEKFVSIALKPLLLTSVSYSKQRWKSALLVFCFSLATLALVRPQWGFHWEETTRQGVDIIIALDVSKSMLAEDIPPSRLVRAQRKIADLLKVIEGDRVGLIAFAGVAFMECPLTLDHSAVALFLDAMDTDLIPVPGTAIGETITTAIKAFEANPKNARVLILMTDGEDHLGDPMEAAKKATEAGVQIYTIGVGNPAGAPIPESTGGFKKDSSGELVLTRLNETVLKDIALETGGSYIRSISGDLDITQIYQEIQIKTKGNKLNSSRKQQFSERYQWPLLLALFCLLLEGFMSDRIVRKTPNYLSGFGNLIVLIGLLISHSVWAGSVDRGATAYKKGDYSGALKEFMDAQVDSPQQLDLMYNTGNSYYKTDQYKEADHLFSSASESKNQDLSKKGFYNRGNTAYRQGKLDDAVADYQKALDADPKDEDAQFNLDFVRQEIKRRLAKGKQEQQSSEGKKKGSSASGDEGGGTEKKGGKREANAKENKKNKAGKPKSKAFHNQDKPMTKEEAQQWLALVNENRPMSAREEMQKIKPRHTAKDW